MKPKAKAGELGKEEEKKMEQKEYVKRLNLKEIKEILNTYRDDDLERISIALPCGTDDGTDGGTQGLTFLFTMCNDNEYDTKMFNLLATKGMKKIEKQFIDKLNYDYHFRKKLENEEADDEDYEEFECEW